MKLCHFAVYVAQLRLLFKQEPYGRHTVLQRYGAYFQHRILINHMVAVFNDVEINLHGYVAHKISEHIAEQLSTVLEYVDGY